MSEVGETERFPEEFVAWFSDWADRPPLVGGDDDEDAYAAWCAGVTAGRKFERDEQEPAWRDE